MASSSKLSIYKHSLLLINRTNRLLEVWQVFRKQKTKKKKMAQTKFRECKRLSNSTPRRRTSLLRSKFKLSKTPSNFSPFKISKVKRGFCKLSGHNKTFRSLSSYQDKKIWKPIPMELDFITCKPNKTFLTSCSVPNSNTRQLTRG